MAQVKQTEQAAQTEQIEQTITLDEEFKIILPPLTKDTYAALEENLLANGCRDSLIVWNNILIDGYNRYEICTKHGIPFNTISKDFETREQVLIWIINNQVSRRNLTPLQLSYFRGLHYLTEKTLKGKYSRSQGQQEHMYQNDTYGSNNTRERLSEQYRVSPQTIARDSKVADAINTIGETSPEAKRKILSGEMKFERKSLNEIAAGDKEELETIVAKIEDGTYEKKPRQTNGNTSYIETATAETDSTFEQTSTTDPDSAAEPPGLHYWKTAILNATADYNALFKKILADGSTEDLKEALESFIEALEKIRKRI